MYLAFLPVTTSIAVALLSIVRLVRMTPFETRHTYFPASKMFTPVSRRLDITIPSVALERVVMVATEDELEPEKMVILKFIMYSHIFYTVNSCT